jgi:hypothetical protein
MKKCYLLILLIIGSLPAIATIYPVYATLNGAQAGTSSTITGIFSGTYNSATCRLNYTLTWILSL